MRDKNILKTPRLLELKKKRRKIIIAKILFFTMCGLVLIGLLAGASRIPALRIKDVEISGNKILEKEDLKRTVEEILSEKYLWLFSKSNVFIYPQESLRTRLIAEYGRINDLNISLTRDRVLHLTLSERTGKYLWCGQDMTEEDKKCYFLDDQGYIFDEAPYFSGEVYFKFYGESAPGQYFLKDKFKKLIDFIAALTKMGLRPVVLLDKDENDLELYLSRGAPAEVRPKVLIKKNSDFEKIIENLDAALGTDPLKTEWKDNYAKLEYIDLRFENKVYYRFND
jgi:cell division septal protein FtsQ